MVGVGRSRTRFADGRIAVGVDLHRQQRRLQRNGAVVVYFYPLSVDDDTGVLRAPVQRSWRSLTIDDPAVGSSAFRYRRDFWLHALSVGVCVRRREDVGLFLGAVDFDATALHDDDSGETGRTDTAIWLDRTRYRGCGCWHFFARQARR